MSDTNLVLGLVGVTIALVVAGVSSLVGGKRDPRAEERLDGLVSGRRKAKADKLAESLLRPPSIEAGQFALLERFLPSMDSLRKLHDQADVDVDFEKLLGIAAGLTALGAIVGYFLLPPLLIPFGAGALGSLPLLFLVQRKKKRIKLFLDALPEAVELMGRALRAGHGLASGFQLVAQELKGPLADEFHRVFEEQNLGVPMEAALRGMAERVPSMDVRFLVTAIIIQRATGGDLAEVLDKIGKLVRM
jgi:tight adherence protein B